MLIKSSNISGEIVSLSMEFEKKKKIVALKKWKSKYKQINILKIETNTDCLGDEITLN